MKIKGEKGAITAYVLVAMLVFTALAIGFFVMSANRQQTQLETFEQLKKIYSNGEIENVVAAQYIGGDIIPVYTEEQLKKIGSNESIYINGKNYTFSTGKTYVLQNDITFNETNNDLFETLQNMIANNTIILEGQGHTITVMVGQVATVYTGDDGFQEAIVDDINEQQISKFVENNGRKVYLYKEGEDNSEITGGWEVWSQDYSYESNLTDYEYLYARASGGGSHFGHIYIKTVKPIDLSDYSKYEIVLKTTHRGSDRGSYHGFSNNLVNGAYYKVTPLNGNFYTDNTIYNEYTVIEENITTNDTFCFFFGGYIDNGNTSTFSVKSIALLKE